MAELQKLSLILLKLSSEQLTTSSQKVSPRLLLIPGRTKRKTRFLYEKSVSFSVNFVAPANKLTSGDICYYDIIIALDLDCMSYNENPAMFNFARSLVRDIFDRFSRGRNIIANQGALRLGIVGFTDRLVIQMNLFEMSSMEGRLNAEARAYEAIEDLRNAQLSRQSNKSYFLHVFGWLSQLFDSRSHKNRELFIISNMVADPLSNGDWEDEDLRKLQRLKSRHFADTRIHTIAVNDQCDFSARTSDWHEDCSYFKAFAVVDDNPEAKRQYNDGSRRVLVPSKYFRSASRRSDFATFYKSTLDRVDVDLSDINLEKCRADPPKAIANCQCASRVHLDCDVCEVGGAGPTGDRGPAGEAGPPGLPGLPGDCGPAGLQGNRGETGRAGPDGVKGLPSPSPPVARSGTPGETGSPGLQGKKGEQGAKGPDGQRGADGRRGQVGNPGDTGTQGDPGRPGLQGERGQDGLTGDAGVQGDAGRNAIDNLRANVLAVKADMKRRLKEAVKDPNFKARVKAMSQQFVGLGNNGKTFVKCKDCDQPVCDPIPQPQCPKCETKHEVVLAVDNSQSVRNDEEVFHSINNVSGVFDNLYTNVSTTGNAMFVHFASRLQVDAVVRIDLNDAVTYYNFTNWREFPNRLPPRKTTDSLVDTETGWNREKAKKYLREFPFHTNRYGEAIEPMERKWLFHNDADVYNWPQYTGVRKQQALRTTRSKFTRKICYISYVKQLRNPAITV